MPIVLDRYLYLTADKKRVVEEGDPAARWTLGGPGSTVSDEDAKACGLAEYLKGKPADEEPKATRPPANKMSTRDLSNKDK